jgi:queuine tRNA-ribosyltransferase
MPVATHAHVRNHTMEEIRATGASICLANTYHLLLRPGVEVFERLGRIHTFMQWDGAVLTDSGGFQIFSLPGEREITEEGARFKSPYDNHRYLLSPETSIATQQAIGSDIMMVLDVCVPSISSEDVTREAMERTHRWALRSMGARAAKDTGQALFAIVQGGVFPALRAESAAFLTAHPFDGFAIGGLAVGESRDQLYAMARHTARLLPADKPRYLMGVGTPIDLVEAVDAGVDMFDCIVPSKMAQQKYAYTFEGQLRLTRAEYRLSDAPLDASCECPVCRHYTRGYLRHLAQGNHFLSDRLLGEHNLWHYAALMRRMRQAILDERWDEECRWLKDRLTPPSRFPRPTGVARGDFEVVATRSGARAVRHRGHGEGMHPVGPWEEANRLYVDQLELERRLGIPTDEPLRILDVGLGAGANAVAALTRAKAMGGRRARPVEIISLEIDLSPLALALDDPEGFPWLEPWAGPAERILSEHRWEEPSIGWRVLVGDAREAIEELDGVFDLCFFDPFSPQANGELWDVGFLRALRSRTRYAGAVLATYSAATPARVAFLLAGFFVGQGESTGTRVETTVAATKKELLRAPLGERWLQRWERSSARSPHGLPITEELERAVREHPQFQTG